MKMKKLIFSLILALSFLSASVYSQDIKAVISEQLERTVIKLSEIVPENTSQLNIWPDAYIGRIFPAIPPHFGVGISVSGTLIDTSIISDAADTLIRGALTGTEGVNIDFSIPDKLPLPTCSINARIGGIFLPFDIGLFGIMTIPGTLDSLKYSDFEGSIEYASFGADLRYALYEGNILLPKISLGAGYIFTRQKLGFSVNNTKSGTYNGSTGIVAGDINSTTDMNLSVKTHTFFAQLQVSKQILVITPFIGARAMVTYSDCDYDWKYRSIVTVGNSQEGDENDSDKGSYSTNGFDFSEIQPQLFTGLGINLPFSQISLNIAWNPRSNYWSGAVSARFKL